MFGTQVAVHSMSCVVSYRWIRYGDNVLYTLVLRRCVCTAVCHIFILQALAPQKTALFVLLTIDSHPLLHVPVMIWPTVILLLLTYWWYASRLLSTCNKAWISMPSLNSFEEINFHKPYLIQAHKKYNTINYWHVQICTIPVLSLLNSTETALVKWYIPFIYLQ